MLSSKLNLKTVSKSPANKVVVTLLSLNFKYHKYGIITFSILTQNDCTHCEHEEKKISEKSSF